MKNDNNTTEDNKLLSDEEFVAMMDAEYHSQNVLDDELQKQKDWNVIDKTLNQENKMSVSSVQRRTENKFITSFSIAAILLIMILPTIYFESDFISDSMLLSERTKGVISNTPAHLNAYTMGLDGGLRQSNGFHTIGSTIVFKLYADIAGSSALLLSKNQQNPEVRFKSNIKHVSGLQLLQIKGNTYGYMVEPTDKNLRFCVITASNKVQLEQKLQLADRDWRAIPPLSCVNLTIFLE